MCASYMAERKLPFHIDGLVQDCSNSNVVTMELMQSSTEPSVCKFIHILCSLSWMIVLPVWMYFHPLFIGTIYFGKTRVSGNLQMMNMIWSVYWGGQEYLWGANISGTEATAVINGQERLFFYVLHYNDIIQYISNHWRLGMFVQQLVKVNNKGILRYLHCWNLFFSMSYIRVTSHSVFQISGNLACLFNSMSMPTKKE